MAIVALNITKNAAILVLQILATDIQDLQKKMAEYKTKLKKEYLAKDENLEDIKAPGYRKNNKKFVKILILYSYNILVYKTNRGEYLGRRQICFLI